MKPAAGFATVILGAVTLVHLGRLVLGVEVTANGMVVPMWISVPAAIVAAGAAIALWRESRKA